MQLRIIVVGFGMQGRQRQRIAGEECVATVDPDSPDADFRDVTAIPIDAFDAALICVPDHAKIGIAEYLVAHGKHVLIEKPLIGEDSALERLEQLARARRAVCYVAYTSRFEPHVVRMRDLIASGELGRVYRCRMFYGNGTAPLVRESAWRDQGGGVIPDLGSHLFDIARFWFGDLSDDVVLVSADRFENRAPDHAVFVAANGWPRLELEVTLLSWRNDFVCDLFAEHGTAHIRSLCKWGPTEFVWRRRVPQGGQPREEALTLVQDDPTWELEYDHFKQMCREGAASGLRNDLWLNRMLRKLSTDAGRVIRQ